MQQTFTELLLTKVPLPKRLAKSVLKTEKKEKHNYYNKEIENKYIRICTRDWLSVVSTCIMGVF